MENDAHKYMRTTCGYQGHVLIKASELVVAMVCVGSCVVCVRRIGDGDGDGGGLLHALREQ